MGIIAWIALGLAAGLLAITLLPAHRAIPSARRVHGPLMTTTAEHGSLLAREFLAREQAVVPPSPLTTAGPIPPPAAAANGTAAQQPGTASGREHPRRNTRARRFNQGEPL
jgi:hypothetical protein